MSCRSEECWNKFRRSDFWIDPWYSSQTILYIGSFSYRLEVLATSIVIYQRDFILTWPRIPHYANPMLSEQHGFGNTREALSKLSTTLALNQVQSVLKYSLSLASLKKGEKSLSYSVTLLVPELTHHRFSFRGATTCSMMKI